jgi:hypothetical protein
MKLLSIGMKRKDTLELIRTLQAITRGRAPTDRFICKVQEAMERPQPREKFKWSKGLPLKDHKRHA